MSAHHVIDIAKALELKDGLLYRVDVEDGRVLCPLCKGTHMVLSGHDWAETPRAEPGYPLRAMHYHTCGFCYDGTARVCKHCSCAYAKRLELCCCDAAQKERRLESDQKRRDWLAAMPRISLAEYKGEMLFCEDTDEWHCVDDELEPGRLYRAAEPTKSWARLWPDNVIDSLTEQAYEAAEDLGDRVKVTDEAKAKLQALLDKWLKDEVELPAVFYPVDVRVEVGS